MKTGQSVKIIWGLFKEQKGIVTEVNNKNIMVMLNSNIEIMVSIDHLEELTDKVKLSKKQSNALELLKEKKVVYKSDSLIDGRTANALEDKGLITITVSGSINSSLNNLKYELVEG